MFMTWRAHATPRSLVGAGEEVERGGLILAAKIKRAKVRTQNFGMERNHMHTGAGTLRLFQEIPL